MSTVRMFETDEQASSAVAELVAEGFRENTISVLKPGSGNDKANVEAAVRAGHLPGSNIHACVNALNRGRTIVALKAPFGYQASAFVILNAAGAVDTDTLPAAFIRDDPAPFSDFLGIPVLSSQKGSTSLSSAKLSRDRFVFRFAQSSSKAAPLSSMFGLKLLTEAKSNWTNSFFFPMLTKSQGPTLGSNQLSKAQGGRNSSLGFRTLSNTATPLSSMFGLRVLSKRRDAD